MTSSLNIQLTRELRHFVDERASDDGVYSTPSEYVRDLIRRDMETRNKTRQHEIATMLLAARYSIKKPLEKDFFAQQKVRLLKQK